LVQVKTNRNVRFDEPTNETISLKVTVDEKTKIVTIAAQNYISISEVLRNLVRDHLHSYALTEELKKNMFISSQIDRVLLETRLISARKETNLSKIREILNDFECFCETSWKKIDIVAFNSRKKTLLFLIELIYQNDEFLSKEIDSQFKRIIKTKTYKYFNDEFIDNNL
jgi:hypothetical protein